VNESAILLQVESDGGRVKGGN